MPIASHRRLFMARATRPLAAINGSIRRLMVPQRRERSAPAEWAPFADPDSSTSDVSFLKIFDVTEHQKLEVRSEFINFTNTPLLQAPTVSVGSTLGLIQSSQGARNIQFGLKYSF